MMYGRPMPINGLLKVHIVARGVDVRAEDDGGQPPQVHVFLYFWRDYELMDAIRIMARRLDVLNLRMLINELKEDLKTMEEVNEE